MSRRYFLLSWPMIKNSFGFTYVHIRIFSMILFWNFMFSFVIFQKPVSYVHANHARKIPKGMIMNLIYAWLAWA